MLIIEELLKNVNEESKLNSKLEITQKHIVNLCDFSGNLLYLLVNQVKSLNGLWYLLIN